jgi:hypothetical protein
MVHPVVSSTRILTCTIFIRHRTTIGCWHGWWLEFIEAEMVSALQAFTL